MSHASSSTRTSRGSSKFGVYRWGFQCVKIEPRSVEVLIGYFNTAVKADSHYSA
jgi:hypothetical protein